MSEYQTIGFSIFLLILITVAITLGISLLNYKLKEKQLERVYKDYNSMVRNRNKRELREYQKTVDDILLQLDIIERGIKKIDTNTKPKKTTKK